MALASAGPASLGDRDAAQRPSTLLLDAALLVLAVVGAGVLVVFAYVYGQAWTPAGGRRRTSPTARVLFNVAVVLVAILAVYAARDAFPGLRDGDDDGNRPGAARAAERDRSSATEGRGGVDWLLVGGAFAVALVGWTAAARFLVRGGREQAPPGALASELVAILDDTLDDLHAERDPRRAVVAAYARMERALGAHGLPRHAFEAPHEYLARALERLQASGSSARRLTALFERACFSTHEVDSGMKDDAIAALETVRDELRVPA